VLVLLDDVDEALLHALLLDSYLLKAPRRSGASSPNREAQSSATRRPYSAPITPDGLIE
jgi:hypothetical protein